MQCKWVKEKIGGDHFMLKIFLVKQMVCEDFVFRKQIYNLIASLSVVLQIMLIKPKIVFCHSSSYPYQTNTKTWYSLYLLYNQYQEHIYMSIFHNVGKFCSLNCSIILFPGHVSFIEVLKLIHYLRQKNNPQIIHLQILLL